MDFSTAVVAQVILLVLTLSILLLRCVVRLRIEGRSLTLSDYFAWFGWVLTCAFVICQGIALHAAINHPLVDATYTDSLTYLKAVYASCFFFDVGLFLPKASITAFYWWLIPDVFRTMRMVLWFTTIYLACAALTSTMLDIFICFPVSDNWSLDFDKQGNSIWNSYTNFSANWALNFSCDILLFLIPCFIMKSLRLRRSQKFGLVGVFSLGLITLAISMTRFMIYTVSDYDLGDNDGAVLCTAEMCTGLIVASLPGLKMIITKTANNISSRINTTFNKSSAEPSQHNSMAKTADVLSNPRITSKQATEIEFITMHSQSRGQEPVSPLSGRGLGYERMTGGEEIALEFKT